MYCSMLYIYIYIYICISNLGMYIEYAEHGSPTFIIARDLICIQIWTSCLDVGVINIQILDISCKIVNVTTFLYVFCLFQTHF